MNREIKFRAWDKLDEMMHIDPFIHQYDGYLNKDWFRLDYLVFMQYTGLKDKNGVEIYEGDIVKDVYGTVGIVKFYDECFQTENFYLRDTIEVIGNIYEHDFLLETK